MAAMVFGGLLNDSRVKLRQDSQCLPPWDDMTVYEFVLPSCLFLKVLFADVDNIILCSISINKLVMIIMNQ